MPVSKGRKKAKQPQPAHPIESPKLCRVLLLGTYNLLRRLGAVIGYSWKLTFGASVVVTILAGGAFFLPRMTVEPTSETVDESVPSPITFVIANTSVIPLWNVQPFLGVCTVDILGGGPGPKQKCSGPLYPRMVGSNKWPKRTLGIDERYTIAIQDAFFIGAPTSGYDISIIVEYEAWFIPWTRHKEFRYETRILADHKIHWFARPLED